MTTRINNSISAEEEACLNKLNETDNEAYPWTEEEKDLIMSDQQLARELGADPNNYN